MLRETRLTMPVMTPDFTLLFIFRFPLLNFGGYGNESRWPPFESRDRRFVRLWLRFLHVRSVPNESAKSNVVAKPGKQISPNFNELSEVEKEALPHWMQRATSFPRGSVYCLSAPSPMSLRRRLPHVLKPAGTLIVLVPCSNQVTLRTIVRSYS